jgi:hypothetical protein
VRINERMRLILEGSSFPEGWDRGGKLPGSLQEIVDGGWLVESDGALLLAAVDAVTYPAASDFLNLTFYEASINHIHVPELDSLTKVDDGRYRSVLVAYSFCAALMRQAQDLAISDHPLMAVIAVGGDVDGTSARIYQRRPGEFWIDDDLDRYADEAIMTFETTDLILDAFKDDGADAPRPPR